MQKENKKPEWEIRSELPGRLLHILNSDENEDTKLTLLEDLIVFIEQGHFLREIEYTSKGQMKDTTFFWEKGELIKIINILPEVLKQRVLPVLLDKIELMLPKEKQSFESLSYASKTNTIPHDRQVFKNLAEIVKNDLLQTRDFLSKYTSNDYGYERASRLLKLIPSDEYFNHYF